MCVTTHLSQDLAAQMQKQRAKADDIERRLHAVEQETRALAHDLKSLRTGLNMLATDLDAVTRRRG